MFLTYIRLLIMSLRDLRLDKGLTQAEVAREIGASAMAVHHWETLGATPTPKFMRKLAAFFERPIPEIRAMCKKPADPAGTLAPSA